MKNLALTVFVATAVTALVTVSTSARPHNTAGHAQTLAMACCDDPPPPCLPGYPGCDKTDRPGQATEVTAPVTVSTSARAHNTAGHAQTLAMACCDDPPPPCLPGYPGCDKTDRPGQATAVTALVTVSTSARPHNTAGHAQALAMACCDDPPPPCLPGYPGCDKTDRPGQDGGGNDLTSTRR